MKLRYLIAKSGYTQESFAKETDCTVCAISRYCTGKRTPNLKTARKIARVLNISMEELTDILFEEE